MVHGRRNFGPAPEHKPDEVKESARKSATEAANERISATRGGPPHETGGAQNITREREAEHALPAAGTAAREKRTRVGKPRSR